ncbi:hypothetical protein DFJ74DRAFT_240452 [Hyaloraphidium curvatum]|nr:hypothetical protein DFJ74DRAFT_240452 [Hyaloraphidium curvatum]
MCDLASVVQFSSRCNRSNEGILYPAPGVVEIRDLIQNRTAQKFTNRSQMFDMSLGFSISQTGLGSAGMKIKNWLNSKRITTLITMDYVTEYFNGRVQYSKLGPEDLNPRFREKFLNLPERFDPTNRTNVDLFDSFYTSFGGHFVSDVTYGTRVTVTKHSSDCTQTSGTSLTLDILADISSQVPGLNFGAAPSWSNNATMQEVLRGSTNYLCGYPFSCTNGIFGCGPTNTTDTRPVYERMVSVSFHVRPIEDAALVMKDLVREGDPRLRAFKNYTQKYEETFAETVQPVRCGVPRGLVWSWAVAAVASITAATALL